MKNRVRYENSPSREGAPEFRPAVQQGKTFGSDQLHGQQLRQLGHLVAVAAIDAYFAVTLTALAQSYRQLALRTFYAAVQHELRLVVADHPTGLQAAKGAAVPEGIHCFQHAGLAAAVGADRKLNPGASAKSAASILRKSLINKRVNAMPTLSPGNYAHCKGVIGAGSLRADSAQQPERTQST